MQRAILNINCIKIKINHSEYLHNHAFLGRKELYFEKKSF